MDGSEERSDTDVLRIAAEVRSELEEYEGAAHGNAGRLVVSVKLDAVSQDDARMQGRTVIVNAVRDAGLKDWRTDHADEWETD